MILEKTFSALGLDGEITPYKYRYVVLGQAGGIFEGVKSMGEFSPQRVVLTLKNAKIIVEGKNLSIKRYGESEIALNGKIISVLVQDD